MRVPCLYDGIYDYEPPPGGLLSAGHGPDATSSESSPVPGCDRVPREAVSGPSLSDERVEEFMKLARAL